ncbi:Ig-like domain-containing protein, partial [Enterobacter hormaechei]
MSQISVISKLTGVETTTEGTQVTLGHSSIVKLNVDRADISGYSRSGNDLVITLHSGEVITLKNFYVTDAQGVSQLVLEESDGALWWIEDPTGAATYESIASTDALLAASGSDTGGAAAWPWVLGGLAVAGGIAIAAGTGGGGGGDDDNNSPNPGNPGNPSEPDTTPPDAPTNLQVSPDGKTVTGTAEPGSTITLKDADGNTIGTGKAGSDGKFTIDLGTPLTNGEQITATATDPSGNTSQGGQVTAPDLTAPDAPANLEVSPDGKTVTGTAEPGSTVTLKDADGNTIGTGKAGSDGKFTIDLGTPLTNGEQITATATDPSGNTSPGVQVTAPDLTAPDAPEIVTVNDNVGAETGPLSNGQRTDDARPTFSGISEAGTVITFYDNGKPIGTATADATGKWSFTPSTNLSEGSHAITTTATDAAGNTSPASTAVTFVVDTVAPGAPAIVSITDDVAPGTGTLGSGSSTNDPRPQLTGTAEAGSTVTIYDNGIAIGTAVVGSNGSWSFTPSVNLSEGSHQLTVRATDVAGNTGPASPVFTVTVDVTAPQTPSGFIINDDTGVLKGAIGAGQFTDASEPRLTGRGEPGSTITVYDNGVVIGTTTVLPNGTWSITPTSPLAEGAHSITLRETDAAGNQSGLSQPINFTVDLTPPDMPVATLNSAGTQITGTAEPGSKIVITNNAGLQIGTATADSNGNYVANLNPAQTNGEIISVVASDAAGNQSSPALV